MAVEIEQLQKEFGDVTNELAETVKKQDDEIRRLGGTTTDTSKTLKSLEEKYDLLEGYINEAKQSADGVKEQFGDLSKDQIDELVDFRKRYEAGELRPGYGREGQIKTLGQTFSESEQYKTMVEQRVNQSAPLYLESLWPHEKALSSDEQSAGVLIEPFRKPDWTLLAQRRLRIRDLLPARPISTNEVEYVVETGFTNEAAFVEENPENPKPESDMTFELETSPVRTLAHWIRASRQVLADAGQLRTRIDQQLLYGLEFVLENQILYGSGIGENLQGIMTHENVQTYAIDDGPATDTRIDAIRRAMTRVELAFFEPTGVVVHPLDWEDIELRKDNEARYLWIVVTEGGVQRLFRLPVVVTPAMNENEALLGAFDIGAMLWDREQAMIRVSEHHSDFFTKNMVAILAELRVALEINRPESFVNISFEPDGDGDGDGDGGDG